MITSLFISLKFNNILENMIKRSAKLAYIRAKLFFPYVRLCYTLTLWPTNKKH